MLFLQKIASVLQTLQRIQRAIALKIHQKLADSWYFTWKTSKSNKTPNEAYLRNEKWPKCS